jgi:hypothetical protein
MAIELYEIKSKKHIIKLMLSNDWRSLTPWKHNEIVQPYFSKVSELSESKLVHFTHWYIGPFAVLSGKWVARPQT